MGYFEIVYGGAVSYGRLINEVSLTAQIGFLFLVFTFLQLFKLLVSQIYRKGIENTICSFKLKESISLFSKIHSLIYVVT